jgi:hypothetical protein
VSIGASIRTVPRPVAAYSVPISARLWIWAGVNQCQANMTSLAGVWTTLSGSTSRSKGRRGNDAYRVMEAEVDKLLAALKDNRRGRGAPFAPRGMTVF